MRGEERDVAQFEQSFQWCLVKEYHTQTDGLQIRFRDSESDRELRSCCIQEVLMTGTKSSLSLVAVL